jgi:hypothetical protein
LTLYYTPPEANLVEKISSQASQSHTDSSIKLGAEAFLQAAVQQPLDGLTQLVNHVADKNILPDPQLFKAPKQAEFGSGGWLAETIGSGLGAAIPYLAVEVATRGALGKAGSMAEGTALTRAISMSAEEAATAGNLAKALRFAAPAGKMAVNGAVFGLVLTPSSDASQGFWAQREKAAASSALTFGTMGLTGAGLMAGAETKLGLPMTNQAFALSYKGIGVRLGANAVGGSVGGLASAESNSLLAGKGFASKEEVGHSMASFMVTGAALDGLHLTGDYYQAAKTVARTRELTAPPKLNLADQRMLEKLQQAHFQYFHEESDPVTGLTKDRSTENSPASIAAVGFSLTAHGVAADHGWISREQAADYSLKVLDNLWNSKQGDEAEGTSGTHGLFYHFINPKTGLRQGKMKCLRSTRHCSWAVCSTPEIISMGQARKKLKSGISPTSSTTASSGTGLRMKTAA